MKVYRVGKKNPQTRTKRSFSFRLSEQAENNLKFIVEKSGMNQTAAVEFALALLKSTLT